VQLSRYSFPVFLVGARRVVGQWAWLARCGSLGLGKACGRREGRSKIKEKQTFSFFPYCNVWGKKKEEQCRSKRHRSLLLSFFFFIMKRRRFGENAPFHLKVAPERAKFQISP
jgi:hypothetical protein